MNKYFIGGNTYVFFEDNDIVLYTDNHGEIMDEIRLSENEFIMLVKLGRKMFELDTEDFE